MQTPESQTVPEKPHTIYLVSDGTCRTCETVVQAILVQFDNINVRLVRKANVRKPDTVRKLIRRAGEKQALVFYTLVCPPAREAILEASIQYQVPVVDILGPIQVALYDMFRRIPQPKPGMLYKSHREYFDRIDAVEYTLHHDDGCRIGEIFDADVVLVGVSRCSKSTTCFYLAYSGIRAANVPLVIDSAPPPELFDVDPRRVIGLTTNPHRLESVRGARLRSWGSHLHEEYADRLAIARELRAANELFAQQGWRCVDVSYKGIEEIAREVRQLLEDAGVAPRPRKTPSH